MSDSGVIAGDSQNRARANRTWGPESRDAGARCFEATARRYQIREAAAGLLDARPVLWWWGCE